MERMCTKCGIVKELDVVAVARIEKNIREQIKGWKIESSTDTRQRRFV